MRYIWILFLFFFQVAWSADETQEQMNETQRQINEAVVSFYVLIEDGCKNLEPQLQEECKAKTAFQVLMSRKTLETTDVCNNGFTMGDPAEGCPLQTELQRSITDHLVRYWCNYREPNPEQCVEKFNNVELFWQFVSKVTEQMQSSPQQ